ncbi:MAG: hypothetical protein WC007_17465 [Pelobacteraceae bacterium]
MIKSKIVLIGMIFFLSYSETCAEEPNDNLLPYLAYLQVKNQILIFKEVCGISYTAKIVDSEKVFISNNPQFKEIETHPPVISSDIDAEVHSELDITKKIIKNQLLKYPQVISDVCDSFVNKLPELSLADLIETTIRLRKENLKRVKSGDPGG